MTKYLAGVLSVIAIGVLLIAYGLLNPRTAIADGYAQFPGARAAMAMPASAFQSDGRVVVMPDGSYAFDRTAASAHAAAAPQYVSYSEPRRTRVARPVSYQERSTRVYRAPGRDWKKTAMVIGGSTAAGAGVGAIFGGKKGALIGAAVGGGASTIYESTKR